VAEDFYVETQECMVCGAPPVAAPNLMGFDENGTEYLHCYFKRQPNNAFEVEEAIAAINASCCGAVQYRGNDRSVIVKISGSIAYGTSSQVPHQYRPAISTPEPGFFQRMLRNSK